MKKFLVGVLVALLSLVAAAFLIIYSGVYNVAATSPHTALVHEMLDTTMTRSVRAHAPGITAPDNLSEPSIVRQGAAEYAEMCVLCHGAPGVEKSPIGKGLNPSPPRLYEEPLDWSRGELFWIVTHGVKMTGMPAFGPTHGESEIWSVVAFLERLPSLSPEQYEQLTEQGAHEEEH